MGTQLIIVVVLILGLIVAGGLSYMLLAGNQGKGELRDLMQAPDNQAARRPERRQAGPDPFELDADSFRKRAKGPTAQEDVSAKLFKAGFFTAADRRWFLRFRIISFIVCVTALPVGIYLATDNTPFAFVCLLLGAVIGFTLPMSWLERQIRHREEDVMYYLPLVIEQVSIGVSSALDVGPCITHIVHMAQERDSHNPVTEMFVHVEKLMRSGLNLEDALTEVAEANGTTEVKHAFMFLAQCAKHGGEVSKQLQELADSVMVQRQVQVEAKITALPVKATGPLATVFAGFFALLFSGIVVRLMGAFGS